MTLPITKIVLVKVDKSIYNSQLKRMNRIEKNFVTFNRKHTHAVEQRMILVKLKQKQKKYEVSMFSSVR